MAEELFLMKQCNFSYHDVENMPSHERRKFVKFMQESLEKANAELKRG